MDVLRSAFPSATYRVIKNSEGLPYFTDPDTGIMVFTEVTIDGVTSECFLPVMDNKNPEINNLGVPFFYSLEITFFCQDLLWHSGHFIYLVLPICMAIKTLAYLGMCL